MQLCSQAKASSVIQTHRSAKVLPGTHNFSEVGGNSAAVAISMAYYPDNRDVSSGVSKLAIQLAVDGASNILKEFWPDLHRKFSEKRQHP